MGDGFYNYSKAQKSFSLLILYQCSISVLSAQLTSLYRATDHLCMKQLIVCSKSSEF